MRWVQGKRPLYPSMIANHISKCKRRSPPSIPLCYTNTFEYSLSTFVLGYWQFQFQHITWFEIRVCPSSLGFLLFSFSSTNSICPIRFGSVFLFSSKRVGVHGWIASRCCGEAPAVAVGVLLLQEEEEVRHLTASCPPPRIYWRTIEFFDWNTSVTWVESIARLLSAWHSCPSRDMTQLLRMCDPELYRFCIYFWLILFIM